MFKADWEKTSITYQLPKGMAEAMVQHACPGKKLIAHDLIAGGCANLHFKIQLEDLSDPLILRVYLSRPDAAYREQKLAVLLKETLPVPLTHYIGEVDGYHFAIVEFMSGISLQDLLLGDATHDLSAIMHEVGVTLSKITAHEFLEAGFFDKELNIIPPSPSDDYLIFAKDCLRHEAVLSVLASDVIAKIGRVFDHYGHLFPDENEKHLVHADFDPANILVHKVDGLWKVSGVLDWEFAFSGSVLCDVANMLRYAHKMPPEFQHAFLKGLGSGGVTLPKNWPITVRLLNLWSLLDCLKRSDSNNRPNQCADIRELIDHSVSEFDLLPKIDRVEIVPYDPHWPHMFETEAVLIQRALGDHCIAIHPIGSTSVPGLAAKPIIDMIPVVRDITKVGDCHAAMEALGYKAMGESGMPLRRFFQKNTDHGAYNLHVFEQNNAEIERHLTFRDWMRTHADDRDAYAELKQNLAIRFKDDILSYCLGKEDFVSAIDKKAGWSGLRFVQALTPREWAAAKHFRDIYFFGSRGIDDPDTWTFQHEAHAHLVLYQGAEIIGYAHVQFGPEEKRAEIRRIAVDENKRYQHAESKFWALIEKWLQTLGVQTHAP